MKEYLSAEWKKILNPEFDKSYFKALQLFIEKERADQQIYPCQESMFSAFERTPPKQIKVVILGQDPYHNLHQANGLSFSVGKNTKIPPTLKNIFRELSTDIGCRIPAHGDLKPWAMQGVFLLNTCLTVRAHQPGSHQNKGWEIFTDQVIKLISNNFKNIVFILWGAYAKKKEFYIDTNKHLILSSTHPSPFSARKGFFGSKPFSKCNDYLTSLNKKKIDWNLPFK
tara:strand:- start:1464 stop:2141 length:678 start_codon:yes stop_codon:yes gene_type:complete